jgi:putative glutamine amidotransferase
MSAEHQTKPLVAVSQRVDVWKDRGERRDALDQRLFAFLLAAGVLPVPVPNNLHQPGADGLPSRDNFDAWLAAVKPRAIVLSGGNDIGEHPERDMTEYGLANYAREKNLPLLGICHGMQMLATWAESELVAVNKHVRTRHRLQIAEGMGRWPAEVNSFHNYTLGSCPLGFAVAARAEDGAIEAIRHDSLRWEGWMWHPEREDSFSPVDIDRLKALFNV